MFVHSTPPLPPRLPPIHPRTFSSSSSSSTRNVSSPGTTKQNAPTGLGVIGLNNRSNQNSTITSNNHNHNHIQSPLAPPPFFRRTSSLRDPPHGGESRSPSIIESEQDLQEDQDDFMAHQTRSGRRKVSRRKDDKV